MTLRLSTGLRDKLLGNSAPSMALIVANTIAFVDGGVGSDTITDSGDGFVTAGFVVGDEITVSGTVSNDGTYTLTGVAAGTLTVATDSLTDESTGTVFAIAAAQGGSLKDTMRNGRLVLYTGSQPATADDAVTSPLVTITESSGDFTAGEEDNGLEFGDADDGELSKASGETWSGEATATGTAGWFRFYGNATDAGAEDTAGTLPRIDGSVGTSGADLNMSSTSITSGATYTIDSFKLTLPYQYGA